MPSSKRPRCLTPGCKRHCAPEQLLCTPCFDAQDRRQRAGYAVLSRLVDDELAPDELERIRWAGMHAALQKRRA